MTLPSVVAQMELRRREPVETLATRLELDLDEPDPGRPFVTFDRTTDRAGRLRNGKNPDIVAGGRREHRSKTDLRLGTLARLAGKRRQQDLHCTRSLVDPPTT
jgi:hypothetical protein